MNLPTAIVIASAILGPCAVICAALLSKRPQVIGGGASTEEERAKLPGLRAPGEYHYRVSYTPTRRSRRNTKPNTTP